jgi:hypothetical protein
MNSKDDFKKLVESVVKKTGKTQEELAMDLGYGKNYISELTSPTGKVTKKFLTAFNLRYANILENPKNQENTVRSGNGSMKVDSHFIPENISASDFIRALITLSESNKALVDNNKIALDSNRVAIETNKTIADTNSALAKRLMEKDSTADSLSSMPTDALATLLAVREQVIELVADVKNTTLDAAEASLGKKAVDQKNKLDKMGNVADKGKVRNLRR